MTRLLIFTAGVIAGLGGALLSGLVTFPGAEAAPTAEVQQWKLTPARPMKSRKPRLRGQRCAAGFKAAPGGRARYGCSRTAAVRCPNGTAPTGLKLYRSGADAASGARLIYDCRASETVRPLCAQGYVPAGLKLYRSGSARGHARLLYECVRYRSGND